MKEVNVAVARRGTMIRVSGVDFRKLGVHFCERGEFCTLVLLMNKVNVAVARHDYHPRRPRQSANSLQA